VTVWYASQDWHTRQSPTQSDIRVIYQMMYWHNLILLMMSTGLLKTCREGKEINTLKKSVSGWLLTRSDSIVGVSDQYWTKHLITSTDGDNCHSTHLTSHVLPVQISLQNKCSFKVCVHLEHATVSCSKRKDTSSTLLQKPTTSTTAISLTVENKQTNFEVWHPHCGTLSQRQIMY